MNNVGRYTIFIFLGFLIALLILFGLANMLTPSKLSGTNMTNSKAPAPTLTVVNPGESTGQGSMSALDLVKKDVSVLTQTNIDQIKLIKQENVNWPDSSLGCPKQGFLYSQVVTPGNRIIVQTNNERFEYHTDNDGHIVMCEDLRLEE